jgi:hypothetical protein
MLTSRKIILNKFSNLAIDIAKHIQRLKIAFRSSEAGSRTAMLNIDANRVMESDFQLD